MTNLPQFHFIISSTVLAFLDPSSSAWMLKKKTNEKPGFHTWQAFTTPILPEHPNNFNETSNKIC